MAWTQFRPKPMKTKDGVSKPRRKFRIVGSLKPARNLLPSRLPLSASLATGEHPIAMGKLRQYLRFMTAVQLLPALESGEETLVGGQAVLEGVMMRSPHAWGISVRKPDGTISTHSEPLERMSEKHKWMGWPVIRGVMTLGQAMVLGFRALRYSADVALDTMPADETEATKKTEISGWVAAINIIFSVGFFIFLYKFVPLVAATKLK